MEYHPPLHLGVVAIEKGAFGLPSTKVTNFTIYIYIYIYACTHSTIYIYIYISSNCLCLINLIVLLYTHESLSFQFCLLILFVRKNVTLRVILEIRFSSGVLVGWGYKVSPLLLLLPVPFWSKVVIVAVKVLFIGQINLFEIMLKMIRNYI